MYIKENITLKAVIIKWKKKHHLVNSVEHFGTSCNQQSTPLWQDQLHHIKEIVWFHGEVWGKWTGGCNCGWQELFRRHSVYVQGNICK